MASNTHDALKAAKLKITQKPDPDLDAKNAAWYSSNRGKVGKLIGRAVHPMHHADKYVDTAGRYLLSRPVNAVKFLTGKSSQKKAIKAASAAAAAKRTVAGAPGSAARKFL
jgi:hypothetical protein